MSTTPEHAENLPADDFVPTDELVRRQGALPITSVGGLVAGDDPFESDDEYADFLADLYSSRRSNVA